MTVWPLSSPWHSHYMTLFSTFHWLQFVHISTKNVNIHCFYFVSDFAFARFVYYLTHIAHLDQFIGQSYASLIFLSILREYCRHWVIKQISLKHNFFVFFFAIYFQTCVSGRFGLFVERRHSKDVERKLRINTQNARLMNSIFIFLFCLHFTVFQITLFDSCSCCSLNKKKFFETISCCYG